MDKRCTKCGDTKPFSDFGCSSVGRDGLRPRCRKCEAAYTRNWYARNRAADVGPRTLICPYCEQQFTYIKKTRGRVYCSRRCCQRAATAAKEERAAVAVRVCRKCGIPLDGRRRLVCDDCQADPRGGAGQRRAREHRRRLELYGLSVEIYDDMVAQAQRTGCTICRGRDPGRHGWQIDHDRSCCPGKGSCGLCVRELLCTNCNLLLGHARDSVENLRRAIAYLEAHTSRVTGREAA